MGEIEAQKTIKEVAIQVQNRMRSFEPGDLEWLIQIAIEGFSDLNYYSGNVISRVKKEVTGSLAINLPADFIREIRVQCLYGAKLENLKKGDFNVYRDLECGEEVAPINYEEDLWLTKVRGFYNVGGDFTSSGEYPWQYAIDYKKRQMFFNVTPPNQNVFIEYLGTGVNDSGETYIPIQMVTPLRNYVMWQMSLLDPKTPASKIQMRQDDYNRSVHAMRHADSLMTYQEYLDEYYSKLKQSPKR